jgi:hypothetical protein
MRDTNIKLNPNKCIFATRNIRLLGHVMSKTKMMPKLPKVRAVSNFLVHVFYYKCVLFSILPDMPKSLSHCLNCLNQMLSLGGLLYSNMSMIHLKEL